MLIAISQYQERSLFSRRWSLVRLIGEQYSLENRLDIIGLEIVSENLKLVQDGTQVRRYRQFRCRDLGSALNR